MIQDSTWNAARNMRRETTMWNPTTSGIHPHCPRCGGHVSILKGEGSEEYEAYYECIQRCGWCAIEQHTRVVVREAVSERSDAADPFCYAETGHAPRFGKYSHTFTKSVWEGEEPVYQRCFNDAGIRPRP